MLFKHLFHFLIPLMFMSFADGDPIIPPATPPAVPPADPNTGVQALIQRHNNDLTAVINHLFNDNYQLREKNRGIKEQVKLLEGKVPAEGAVILGADEAKLLEAYKALGGPEDLNKFQGEFQTVKAELDTLKRESMLETAATAHGYKASVLKTLVKEAQVEMREVEKDGQKKPAAFVLNGDQAINLDDYVSKNFADFLPALRLEASPPGTQFIPQGTGGQNPKGDVVSNFVKKAQETRDSQTNPLVKK